MIEAVVFDLGGTLVEYAGTFQRWPDLETPGFYAAHDYLRRHGVAVPGIDRFRRTGFDLLPVRWKEAMAGERNLRLLDLLAEVLAICDVLSPEPAVLEAAAERYQTAVRAGAKPINGGRDVMTLLKAGNYRLGLLSNTMFPGRAHVEDLVRFGLAGYLDAMLFSADANMWKPRVEPFHHVLSELGVDPGRAVFVGDDPAVDVVGGRRAGMFTIHFRSSGRFRPFDGVIPDAIIDSLGEIPQALALLNASQRHDTLDSS